MAANPIQIVPLRTEAAAPVGTPRLTYRGGPLLASPQVFLFFWGSRWRSDPLAETATTLNGFFDYLLASPLMDQLAEYSVPAFSIGHGARTGSLVLTDDPPPTVADSDIQGLVSRETASGPAVPRPTPSSLYFVYLPPGVAVSLSGGASCTTFCGYHSDVSNSVFYAVMPYPDCKGCEGGMQLLDALTATSSHELCEAITDPVPGEGWYDDANGEIGDICAWKTKRLGGYSVQMEWSNKNGACV